MDTHRESWIRQCVTHRKSTRQIFCFLQILLRWSYIFYFRKTEKNEPHQFYSKIWLENILVKVVRTFYRIRECSMCNEIVDSRTGTCKIQVISISLVARIVRQLAQNMVNICVVIRHCCKIMLKFYSFRTTKIIFSDCFMKFNLILSEKKIKMHKIKCPDPLVSNLTFF